MACEALADCGLQILESAEAIVIKGVHKSLAEKTFEEVAEPFRMREEDDWLDWKVARDMLESWLGLRQEVGH